MFHVPEQYRIVTGRMASNVAMGNNGCFVIWKRSGRTLVIIASDGMGWEHVSIHVETNGGKKLRTPEWSEMCEVKDLFWDAEDVVIQYHPRKSEYVNVHSNTLHLWRPVNVELPRPPKILIG